MRPAGPDRRLPAAHRDRSVARHDSRSRRCSARVRSRTGGPTRRRDPGWSRAADEAGIVVSRRSTFLGTASPPSPRCPSSPTPMTEQRSACSPSSTTCSTRAPAGVRSSRPCSDHSPTCSRGLAARRRRRAPARGMERLAGGAAALRRHRRSFLRDLVELSWRRPAQGRRLAGAAEAGALRAGRRLCRRLEVGGRLPAAGCSRYDVVASPAEVYYLDMAARPMWTHRGELGRSHLGCRHRGVRRHRRLDGPRRTSWASRHASGPSTLATVPPSNV